VIWDVSGVRHVLLAPGLFLLALCASKLLEQEEDDSAREAQERDALGGETIDKDVYDVEGRLQSCWM
jgi:hypothetical protein